MRIVVVIAEIGSAASVVQPAPSGRLDRCYPVLIRHFVDDWDASKESPTQQKAVLITGSQLRD